MDSIESDVSSADEFKFKSEDTTSTSPEPDTLANSESCYYDADFGNPDFNEDTRSELKFDITLESDEEKAKRRKIEEALQNGKSTLQVWRDLAIEEYGLVADDLRLKIWPLLLEVDPDTNEKIPSLDELSSHDEYHQVVLDVNRSLKRFPPGIPYKQRLALQDQLTVLILRVIIKHPYLRYYQGYHDVAITFLLVVGEALAFRIMERLSTDHLRRCMKPTMDQSCYDLNYIYCILQKADRPLQEVMDEASVGIMFALPWYLTWFGHSLNQYKDVVRLYDYFLASPRLMPVYVAAALVVERRDEVLECECDMAMIHCKLSQIPDHLDFESILTRAATYYRKYPPEKLESGVKKRVQSELNMRKREEARMRRRLNKNQALWTRISQSVPQWLVFSRRSRYGLLFATATVLIGIYAYYLRANDPKYSFSNLFNT